MKTKITSKPRFSFFVVVQSALSMSLHNCSIYFCTINTSCCPPAPIYYSSPSPSVCSNGCTATALDKGIRYMMQPLQHYFKVKCTSNRKINYRKV